MNEVHIDEALSDLEVWNLFRSGSDAAFHFIYQKYFDKLYNYGCQFTKDKFLVEDTLQDLFLDLKRRSQHLSQTDRILPYLYSAFRRKIIRFRNKQNKFEQHDLESSFAIVGPIDEVIINNEQQKEDHMRLQKALNALPENFREIVYLFYYENLTYEEIKEIQGFENIKSARNLLYKALKMLRNGLLTLVLLLLTIERCVENSKT